MICPSLNGGKNWPAGAYSPLTNTMYMPLQNMCMTTVVISDKQDVNGPLYGINNKVRLPDGIDKVGVVHAISAETGQTVWKHEQRAGTLALVATGGGLIFVGDAEGFFRALDDKTGKVLWEVNLGTSVSGYPITFAVERQAVRRREHGAVARRWQRDDADARAQTRKRQSDVRVCVAVWHGTGVDAMAGDGEVGEGRRTAASTCLVLRISTVTAPHRSRASRSIDSDSPEEPP